MGTEVIGRHSSSEVVERGAHKVFTLQEHSTAVVIRRVLHSEVRSEVQDGNPWTQLTTTSGTARNE